MRQGKRTRMKRKTKKKVLHVSARKSVDQDVDVLRSQRDAPAVVGVKISVGTHQ